MFTGFLRSVAGLRCQYPLSGIFYGGSLWRKAKTKKKYEKTLTLMEPKEWYKASELIKDLDIKERRTRELLNELEEKGMFEEKGVTKGKRYRKK